MNTDQRHCYDTIMERVKNSKNYSNDGFFINAPGGTGKSFLLNALLDTLRSTEKIALAVASSGIAATVLHGGRTAHNMFKIPIMDHKDVRACSVKRNSEHARLLEMTSLIVWDEAVMANKNAITALDITMRDNVRLKNNDILNRGFAEDLLKLGVTPSDEYEFPLNFGVLVDSREELVNTVYSNLEDNFLNVSYFEKRVIITPTNDDVDCVNNIVFKRLKNEEFVYRSEDKSIDNEMDIQTSVYNSINSPSIPLHELKLKIGAVVMVLRNICPPKLCNGTRIMITNLKKHIIVGNILTGAYKDEQVMLPKVTLDSTDTSVFFKRKQFPVRLCYAMTINKSQGQTFDTCGLLLDSSQCFAHGQLYVACSRVTSHDSLIIYTGYRKNGDSYERKPAHNCVYKEVFGVVQEVTDKKPPSVNETINSTPLRVAEEEPDHSTVVIPSISEEQAINMIMPDEFYRDNVEAGEDTVSPMEMVEKILEVNENAGKKFERREKELKEEAERSEDGLSLRSELCARQIKKRAFVFYDAM
ncbi:ATP-dependent DNA helicase Pif1-like [Oratosquilla oratoria]|uniref:ATP-dependent DNA helicase Pif1-like n=1 Tax=Oratosquilla oratoria TaxID=337810 RepID=UPI003F76079D